MDTHVIVGAGPVGSTTALLLAEDGHHVLLVSRSGSGPDHPGIERVTADAADRVTMLRLSVGATAVYNCANPAYHRWPTDWPPIASSLLQAAKECSAVLVTMSNLYGYGPIDHAMSEGDELAATIAKGRVRANMWVEARAAHEAGQVRATEARASDFFGPRETSSHFARMIPRTLAGKTVRVFGDPDTPHSWTYLPDVARTLVILARDERAWGRPWHVPTNPPLSQRQVVAALADLANVPAPQVRGIPGWVVRVAGVASPLLRELHEVLYQFERPFVLDSSAVTATFGLQPTPMTEALATTLEWWRPARETPAERGNATMPPTPRRPARQSRSQPQGSASPPPRSRAGRTPAPPEGSPSDPPAGAAAKSRSRSTQAGASAPTARRRAAAAPAPEKTKTVAAVVAGELAVTQAVESEKKKDKKGKTGKKARKREQSKKKNKKKDKKGKKK